MLVPDLSCRVLEETLTDGSTVHNVVLQGPEGSFTFHAVTHEDALTFSEKLADLICAHTVDECITY